MTLFETYSNYNELVSFGTVFMSLVFSVKLWVQFFIRNFIQKTVLVYLKKMSLLFCTY